jgi:hypothetical protein
MGTMSIETSIRAARPHTRHALQGLLLLAAALALGAGAQAGGKAKACSATAKALFSACRAETSADLGKATAICLNGDEADERDCLAAAKEERKDVSDECKDQYDARSEICDVLGEDRYAPDFDPMGFQTAFDPPAVPNPYIPLTIGNTWDYASATETTHIEVLDATKSIEGVTCVVERDQVSVGGKLVEDTDDWVTLALNGDAWYCGEEVKDYEVFAGDQPMNIELVAIEGSFKTGRDGDKPGLLFPMAPFAGQLFRQEFSVGNAEDIVEVVETNYVFGNDATLDDMVPQALADHLCGAGCVVTRDSTPLEPEVVERKYYAPGIGVFLEIAPDTGEVNQLVDCNFDARCDTLP